MQPVEVSFVVQARAKIARWPMSANDVLDPAILRLADPRAGGHQQLGITETLGSNRTLWHAVAHQFSLHRVRTTDGQAHVVARRPGCVGVAVHLYPRVLHP